MALSRLVPVTAHRLHLIPFQTQLGETRFPTSCGSKRRVGPADVILSERLFRDSPRVELEISPRGLLPLQRVLPPLVLVIDVPAAWLVGSLLHRWQAGNIGRRR